MLHKNRQLISNKQKSIRAVYERTMSCHLNPSVQCTKRKLKNQKRAPPPPFVTFLQTPLGVTIPVNRQKHNKTYQRQVARRPIITNSRRTGADSSGQLMSTTHKRGVCPSTTHKRGVCPSTTHKRGVCPSTTHKRGVCPSTTHRRGVCPSTTHKRGVCARARLISVVCVPEHDP